MSEQSNIPATIKLLGIDELTEATGESGSTIYEKIKLGRFPKPIKIGRKNKWRASTIEGYLDRLERRAK